MFSLCQATPVWQSNTDHYTDFLLQKVQLKTSAVEPFKTDFFRMKFCLRKLLI